MENYWTVSHTLEFSSLTKIREKSVSFSKEQHVASKYLKLNMELLKKKF